MAKYTRSSRLVPVRYVNRSEGPLYTVQGEDEPLTVFDSTVTVMAADGKVYIHKTFTVKGYVAAGQDEDGEWHHNAPNRNYKAQVQAFISRIEARGVIDLQHWDEFHEETPEQREAYNLKVEADERAWEGHAR